ncbi:WAT1-related protein, partial [Mucuna pruriens]
MQYTSASFASAIMNAVPSVTFILAVILRLEHVNVKEIRSLAKVIGTLVTFGGALLMTLYKGPQIKLFFSPNTTHQQDGSHSPQSTKNWVSGTLFLLLGCVAWSSFFILQAIMHTYMLLTTYSITLKRYPAKLSLSALVCLSGALQAFVVALAGNRHSGLGIWALGWNFRLYGPLYTGIVTSGIAYYVQGLVLQRKGPVFLTAFNPLCMIITTALGSFLFAEQLHLGSIIGAIVIALGLYSVNLSKAMPYLLTVGLQFGFAGSYIFCMASLNRGMNRFVFVVYRNAIAALLFAPFAFIFERKIRPKMTLPVFLQIMALGFLELERVNVKEVRSLAKVIGTLVTFGGALLMTFYKGPQINLFYSPNTTHHQDGSHSPQDLKRWISGTLFLLLGCVAWSSFIILQSITLKRYPAEMSLSSMVCLAGALQAFVVALVATRQSGLRAWALGWDFRLYGPLYAGIVSSGITYYVQGLVLQRKGPVIIGAIIIALGLYSVVWGKGKDYSSEPTPPSTTTKQTETQQLPITSSHI